MIIRKNRIRSESYLNEFKKGSNLTIKVNNVLNSQTKIEKFGFKLDDVDGTTILPSVFNSYSRKNAEQFYTIDKTLPKEKYTQTIYWTRTEWAGRGKTREVTEFTDIVRERYHRDYHLPYSVEFTLSRTESENSIVSQQIKYVDDNIKKIINTINLVLSLFGECEIISDEEPSYSTPAKVVHVNWDILPKGKYPWTKVKKSIESISKKYNNTQKEMMLRNCEEINKLSPDFVAYGRAGFRGYAVFGFTDKNLYILESMFPNNATYIFEKDWEELSMLSKGEILNQSLHKARIIHTAKWNEKFEQIMGK